MVGCSRKTLATYLQIKVVQHCGCFRCCWAPRGGCGVQGSSGDSRWSPTRGFQCHWGHRHPAGRWETTERVLKHTGLELTRITSVSAPLVRTCHTASRQEAWLLEFRAGSHFSATTVLWQGNMNIFPLVIFPNSLEDKSSNLMAKLNFIFSNKDVPSLHLFSPKLNLFLPLLPCSDSRLPSSYYLAKPSPFHGLRATSLKGTAKGMLTKEIEDICAFSVSLPLKRINFL